MVSVAVLLLGNVRILLISLLCPTVGISDIAEIQKHFEADRATLPPMFIATPTDKLTSQWTRHKPSAQIMTRLAQLAQLSYTTLEKQLVTANETTDFKVRLIAVVNGLNVV